MLTDKVEDLRTLYRSSTRDLRRLSRQTLRLAILVYYWVIHIESTSQNMWDHERPHILECCKKNGLSNQSPVAVTNKTKYNYNQFTTQKPKQ